MNAPSADEATAGTPAGSARSGPLRVLHFTAVEVDNYYLNNLADYRDRERVEYCFATTAPEGSFVERMRERGVHAEAFRCASRTELPAAARRLATLVHDRRIDILHGHLFDPTIVAAAVSRLTGTPLVTTRHHSDFIHTLASPLKRRFYLALESFVNRTARHIIAPAQMVRDVLVSREGVPARKISVIPYGQTTERFDAVTPEVVAKTRADLGIDRGPAIVCVSRLSPEKGHQYLLEAFDGLVRSGLAATLFLVGTGPLEARLRYVVSERRLGGRVRFLGWRNDALAIIAAADLVVHSSLQEALPSAVIEALMMERPLVATDVSGVVDIVGPSEHGMVVPPGDSDALRRAIEDTIADLPAARLRAATGRRFVLSYMDARSVAAQYQNCYERVTGRTLRGCRKPGGAE